MKKKLLIMLVGIIFFGKTNGQINTRLDSLTKNFLEAQTKNQVSQSEYYNTQKNAINAQWITLFGTLGGGIVGILGGLLVSRINKRNEKEKQNEQIKIEKQKNIMLAASELMKKAAEGFHSVTWVLWIAKNTPKNFSITLIDSHDNNMNKIYPEILGAQVILSGHSKKIYDDTKEIVNHLYKTDGVLAKHAYKLKDPTTRIQAIDEIGKLWNEVYSYSRNIPEIFSQSIDTVIKESNK